MNKQLINSGKHDDTPPTIHKRHDQKTQQQKKHPNIHTNTLHTQNNRNRPPPKHEILNPHSYTENTSDFLGIPEMKTYTYNMDIVQHTHIYTHKHSESICISSASRETTLDTMLPWSVIFIPKRPDLWLFSVASCVVRLHLQPSNRCTSHLRKSVVFNTKYAKL